MKQTIKLTESDLHRIVKESVNKVLTEMDYKTYLDASIEARKRGDMDYWREKGVKGAPNLFNKASKYRHMSNRFSQAARDAFNRDYGYGNGRSGVDGYQGVELGGGNTGYGKGLRPQGKRVDGYKTNTYDSAYDEVESPEEFFQGNQDASDAYRKAVGEFNNWKDGNYEYQKGKGYQLKK